jgi:hypothetical protein
VHEKGAVEATASSVLSDPGARIPGDQRLSEMAKKAFH